MSTANLVKQWKIDEKAIFKGWDFSYIKNRFIQEEPHWNYIEDVKKFLVNATSVLDMATGGGEHFAKYAPFKINAVAIEGYEPNVPVAKKHLEPLGVKVIKAKEVMKLPFKNNEFDLVLNRHGGINEKSVSEVHRVLCKKGIFLTQQIDAQNFIDLINDFGKSPKWQKNTLGNIKKYLVTVGFKIFKSDEWIGKIIFKDVGAIVYFLKAVPWLVEDFTVDRYLNKLKELQAKVESDNKIVYTTKRFYIQAKKT